MQETLAPYPALTHRVDTAPTRTTVSNTTTRDRARFSARFYAALILVLLVTFALGANGLNRDGIWFDEWWSLYNAGAVQFRGPLSPGDIWARVLAEDVWQTPGYPLALSVWGNLVGWTEYSGRVSSLLAGVLACAVVARLAMDWLAINRRERFGLGLAAAVAFGGSAWTIYYLHEMRVYTILMLLTAAFALLYLRLVRRTLIHIAPRSPWFTRQNAPLYVAFILCGAGLLYAHYYGAAVLVVVGLWHLANAVRFNRQTLSLQLSRAWWTITACLIVAGLLFLPWLTAALTAIGLAVDDARVPLGANAFPTLARNLLVVFSSNSPALLLILFIVSLTVRGAWRVWAFALGLFATIAAISAVLQLYELRYATAMLPILAVIAGIGLYGLGRRRIPLWATGAIWFATAVLFGSSFDFYTLISKTPPRDTRGITTLLRPHLREGDLILDQEAETLPSALQAHPLRYYLWDTGARVDILEIFTLNFDLNRFAARLDEILSGAPRVWTIYSRQWVSEEWSFYRRLMDERGYRECAVLADSETLFINAYGRVERSPAPAAFTVDDQANAIMAWAIAEPMMIRVEGETQLQVWAGMEIAPTVPPNTYSIGLHLLNADGVLIAQSDSGLPGVGTACQMRELALPADLLPGDYTLHAVVYDWQTGARLNGQDGAGAATDAPVLSQVRVGE